MALVYLLWLRVCYAVLVVSFWGFDLVLICGIDIVIRVSCLVLLAL